MIACPSFLLLLVVAFSSSASEKCIYLFIEYLCVVKESIYLPIGLSFFCTAHLVLISKASVFYDYLPAYLPAF